MHCAGAGIEHRATNALSHKTITDVDQASIKNNFPVVRLETALENNANVRLILEVSANLEDANVRTVA